MWCIYNGRPFVSDAAAACAEMSACVWNVIIHAKNPIIHNIGWLLLLSFVLSMHIMSTMLQQQQQQQPRSRTFQW